MVRTAWLVYLASYVLGTLVAVLSGIALASGCGVDDDGLCSGLSGLFAFGLGVIVVAAGSVVAAVLARRARNAQRAAGAAAGWATTLVVLGILTAVPGTFLALFFVTLLI